MTAMNACTRIKTGSSAAPFPVGAFLAAVTSVLLAAGIRAEQPLDLVDSVDLERYQGRWHEIARLPNRFQSQCVSDVSAHYTLREDGRVDVVNRCRTAGGGWSEVEGIARRQDPDGSSAALEVRFAPRWLSIFPFVWGDYRIIALDEDYEYSMVGSGDREYLWILARDRSLADQTLQRLISEAARQGFDVDRLVFTEHGE
jgi:apolipoprotein D and lipocalin family protein